MRQRSATPDRLFHVVVYDLVELLYADCHLDSGGIYYGAQITDIECSAGRGGHFFLGNKLDVRSRSLAFPRRIRNLLPNVLSYDRRERHTRCTFRSGAFTSIVNARAMS
eukprot:SAG31_NODE_1198_length_9441_cov_3.648897_8_plen_109_part_00